MKVKMEQETKTKIAKTEKTGPVEKQVKKQAPV